MENLLRTKEDIKTKSPLFTVKEAQDLILSKAYHFGSEVVSLSNAYGRVVAEDIFADRNYPPFNRSAVDGFAIRLEDLSEQKQFTLIEEVHAGSTASLSVTPCTTIKVMTGAPVPEGANAVIKVEDAYITGNGVTFKADKVKDHLNISKEGEDAMQGKMVVAKNQACMPAVMSALAAVGKAMVKVYRLPSVAILSTGNELKDVNATVAPYQIRDSNAYALTGLFCFYGIIPSFYEIVRDDKEKLKEALKKVRNADIIVLSGGVSMGDADFVPEVLKDIGVAEIFHKTKIKPGKPVWFGANENNSVFALPGNPFSVQVAFKIFIEPFLRKSLGMTPDRSIRLPLNGIKKKKTVFDEYFPCRIVDSKLEITSFNGSGDITAALSSDGIALHPSGQEEIREGDAVEFFFWKNFA